MSRHVLALLVLAQAVPRLSTAGNVCMDPNRSCGWGPKGDECPFSCNTTVPCAGGCTCDGSLCVQPTPAPTPPVCSPTGPHRKDSCPAGDLTSALDCTASSCCWDDYNNWCFIPVALLSQCDAYTDRKEKCTAAGCTWAMPYDNQTGLCINSTKEFACGEPSPDHIHHNTVCKKDNGTTCCYTWYLEDTPKCCTDSSVCTKGQMHGTCCRPEETRCENMAWEGGCCSKDQMCCASSDESFTYCCDKDHGICCGGKNPWGPDATACCDARTEVCSNRTCQPKDMRGTMA